MLSKHAIIAFGASLEPGRQELRFSFERVILQILPPRGGNFYGGRLASRSGIWMPKMVQKHAIVAFEGPLGPGRQERDVSFEREFLQILPLRGCNFYGGRLASRSGIWSAQNGSKACYCCI